MAFRSNKADQFKSVQEPSNLKNANYALYVNYAKYTTYAVYAYYTFQETNSNLEWFE